MTEITPETNLWFPGIYNEREGAYAQKVADVPFSEIERLVQQRAKEDGEWSIAQGHVGDNEDVMRKMMEWVSRPDNIQQCVDSIFQEDMEHERTVDFVCRDLANGSKWVGGSRD